MTNTPIWDDEPWPALPSVAGEQTAFVCVVGLGGSGLACVGELLDLGIPPEQVIGVDAGPVGGAAAGRNGGLLLAGLAWFYHDAIAAIGHERAREVFACTLEEMARMERETPDLVRRTGTVRLAWSPEEEADCARQLDAMRADGFPVEPYEGPDGRGLLFPADGSFLPMRRARATARALLARGARLYEGSRAVGFEPGLVLLEGGARVRAERIVVAVDGRLERLLPELAGRARSARLQMLATAPAEEVRIPRPVYARWGWDYWQQLDSGAVVLGGGRDVGGEAEWTTSTDPTQPVQSALERILRDRLGVRAPVTHRWAASVSFTTTGLPILDEVRPSLWAVGAYSGTGNVLGRLAGRAAAQLATHGTSAIAPILAAPRDAAASAYRPRGGHEVVEFPHGHGG
jgi:gamma-glutamylputrescine oxidase